MKTIPEIIDLSVSSIDNLPAAMLYTKVLSDSLGNPKLSVWIDSEVNGYSDPREVPNYRRIRGRMVGDFEKYLEGFQLTEVPIVTLGHEVYDLVSQIALQESVSAIAQYPDDGTTHFPIGMQDEVLGLINAHFGYRGRFLRVMNGCPAGSIRIVLSHIQRMLVSLLSEMNQLFPTPETLTSVSPEEEIKLDSLVGRYINNGPTYINSTIISVDQSQNDNRQIHVGDWDALQRFFNAQRISNERQEEAKHLMDRVVKGDESEEVQRELKEWLGEAAADAAGEVGEAIKGEVKELAAKSIVDALKRYAPGIIKWGWIALV